MNVIIGACCPNRSFSLEQIVDKDTDFLGGTDSPDTAGHDHDHDQGGSGHLHDRFGSIGIERDGDINELDFNDWLTAVFTKYGNRLYRAKGIIFFSAVDDPTVLQCVQSHVEMQRAPLQADGGPRRSRIVFIGETAGLDVELRAGFEGL